MLSYRHAFHAGNFADVLKHTVLVDALQRLARKPAPLLYLDTHAGAGRYALEGRMAATAREADAGVARALAAADPPAAIGDYLQLIRQVNPPGRLQHYPGSPALAQALLRPEDRMLLCELHPADHGALAALLGRRPRCRVLLADGLAALKSELPPLERRGLVLIDPPYERRQEYRQVPTALAEGLARFATGVWLLWYPRLQGDPAAAMIARLARSLSRPTLQLDLALGRSGDQPGMDGCGMLVINPPWGLAESMRAALPWLALTLGRSDANSKVHWLVPEQSNQQPAR